MAGGHQKKRSSLSEVSFITPTSAGHISSFSTASALSRQPLPGRPGAVGGGSRGKSNSEGEVLRELTDSPPASAYFTSVRTKTDAGDEDVTPVPAPGQDVASHFAYSTTLRRHSLGHGLGESPLLPLHASSSKAGETSEVLESVWTDGAGPSTCVQESQETQASIFARSSVGVRKLV